MTIQEYNDIYKNPIVKSMRITSSGGVTITNTNICMEQMSLEESLCSENSLVFGACESVCFKIRIADMNHNFEGEWLTVNQLVAIDDGGCLLKEDGSYLLTEDGDRISLGAHDNAIPYGRFKVFSDKPTNDRRWRDLTCYDAMYDILNAEVIDWYNGLTFPMTMKNFRDSFFTYVGVTQATVTLVNDSFMIQGGFSNEGSLSGKTIITSICELNGVFGHISREGQFEYISLPSADSLTLDWYMDGTGAYEDYTVQKITGITAKSSEEDVGTTVGTDTNVYIVQDNPLIYGSEGTQGLTTALTNMLNNVKDITYRPFNVSTYGNPMLPLGTNLTISTRNQTINSFLMSRVLSGIQSLKDSISADGEKYVPSQVNSLRTETKRTKGKIHELVNNVDELRSTIEDLDEEVSSEIQQLSDTIVLKVDASGNIVKVALSANPSTGSTFAVNADNISFKAGSVLRFNANNIVIDSTYFKVDQYGNLTSTSGTIGGWEINSNGLRSEHDYTSYSTYMNLSSQLGEIEIGQNTDVLGNSRIKIDYDSINFLSDYANSGTEYNVLSLSYTRGTTTGDVGSISLYDNYDNRHVWINGSDGLRIFDNNTTKTHVSKDGFYDSSFWSNEVLVTNSSGVIVTSNISTTKLGYLSGVTSDIQTQLNGKQATITGGATTIVSDNLTASKALVSNSNGKVAVSSVTATELGYVSGATSNIQGQIDGLGAKSVSGNPVVITDAEAMNADHVVATIAPTQTGSGTPSPSNVRPFVPFTSVFLSASKKNLFNSARQVNSTFTDNLATIISNFLQNGKYAIGYMSGDTATMTLNANYSTAVIPVKVGQTYTITSNGANFSRIVFTDGNGTKKTISGGWLTTYTHTVTEDEMFMLFSTVLLSAVQIELSETATQFEEFQGNQYTVQLGDTYYGGTLDVTSGKLIVKRGKSTISGLSRTSATMYYTNLTNAKSNSFTVMCDKEVSAQNANSVGVYTNIYGALRLNTPTGYESSAACLAAYGGSFDVCYELATPIEIQLTPTQIELLENNNTITTNVTSLDITYQTNTSIGDTASALDKRVTSLESTQNYSLSEQKTGKYWIDGKPIYQKTIFFAGGSSGGLYNIPHNITDLDKVIYLEGFYEDSSGDNPHMILPRVSTDGYNIGIKSINNTNVEMAFNTVWGSRLINVYITMRYTKTTD